MKRFLTFALAAALLTSCSDNDDNQIVTPVTPGDLAITLDTRVGSEDFALNKDFAIGGQTLNFNKFRYWVSNVVLVDTKGSEYVVPQSYYLMEEVGDLDLSGTINDKMTYPANKRETITLKDIPAGEYKTIKFSIGVDSKYNDNLSLKAGELTIANGMSNIAWMWHSSYLFTSVGGTVKKGADSKAFTAETGLNANYKSLSIDLPAPVNSSTSKGVVLNLDVTKVLDGIDVMANPAINAMTAPLMSTISTNYATKAIVFGSEAK
ncbi:MbnP family protein [Dyadobacter sp.]|uniref:MbnP family protein n=1 Tax=Dyadobacter sp. TaxID=1914288 RepID=UPI003F6F644B